MGEFRRPHTIWIFVCEAPTGMGSFTHRTHDISPVSARALSAFNS
jgi:hypothetical protein